MRKKLKVSDMRAIKHGTDRIAELEVLIVRPMAEWREDCGPVLWWHFPVCEPPEVGYGPGSGECSSDGTPTSCASGIESGWLTHWSHIPVIWDDDGQPILHVALDALFHAGGRRIGFAVRCPTHLKLWCTQVNGDDSEQLVEEVKAGGPPYTLTFGEEVLQKIEAVIDAAMARDPGTKPESNT